MAWRLPLGAAVSAVTVNETAKRAAAANLETVQTRHARVWLVDDDQPLRELLKELLQHAGLSCPVTCGSAAEVMQALARETAPEVILLDVHLADQNGLDAIAPMKRLAPATEILMLTTFYDCRNEAQALAAGASGFLLKSDPVPEIVRCVRAAAKLADPAAPLCGGGTGRGFRGRGTAHLPSPLPTVIQEKRPAATELCDRPRVERVSGLFRALLGGGGFFRTRARTPG